MDAYSFDSIVLKIFPVAPKVECGANNDKVVGSILIKCIFWMQCKSIEKYLPNAQINLYSILHIRE